MKPAHCISWRDGITPVSDQFQDPYFSTSDGAAEAAHVFLSGNDLPARFHDGFRIAELGFGTGLNFLVTCAAWAEAGRTGKFRFTSFEAFPLAPADMARALAHWPHLAAHAEAMTRALQAGPGPHEIGPAILTLIPGDARETLPRWDGEADAWFLDGFAPARNPELWEPALMRAVAGHTAPGGTFATYTAAGAVRRSLADAGFAVERSPGYGHKRHMTSGRLA